MASARLVSFILQPLRIELWRAAEKKASVIGFFSESDDVAQEALTRLSQSLFSRVSASRAECQWLGRDDLRTRVQDLPPAYSSAAVFSFPLDVDSKEGVDAAALVMYFSVVLSEQEKADFSRVVDRVLRLATTTFRSSESDANAALGAGSSAANKEESSSGSAIRRGMSSEEFFGGRSLPYVPSSLMRIQSAVDTSVSGLSASESALSLKYLKRSDSPNSSSKPLKRKRSGLDLLGEMVSNHEVVGADIGELAAKPVRETAKVGVSHESMIKISSINSLQAFANAALTSEMAEGGVHSELFDAD